MFLSLATTPPPGADWPATDLGYLLHKHPARMHEVPLAFGRAVMAYPRADATRTEFALALDIDPVALVRARKGHSDKNLARYVDDRPYAASSFLSVAIAQALGTALNGRSRERPDLADSAIPLAATVAPLPLHGDPGFVRHLFEPLGWVVTLEAETDARYGTLRLVGTQRLADLLTHLYVLVPVMDRAKHYWIGPDEVDKLMAKGGDWLATHPERDRIVAVNLKGRRAFVNDALARLDATLPDTDEPTGDDEAPADDPQAKAAESEPLWRRRYGAVLDVVRETGAATVADIGCAEGKLAVRLAREKAVRCVLALDTSSRALDFAAERVHRLPETVRAKVDLVQGALGYRDRRLDGIDAALLVEVIEHLDPERIPLAMQALFASRPHTVVVTTPNREHNVLYGLDADRMRHPDHRFEWTRAEFRAWAQGLADGHGYAVAFRPIGDEDEAHGPPTQMAVLTGGDA